MDRAAELEARAFELSEFIVHTCLEKKLNISLAESITGGLIAKSITDIPGASSVLFAGYVTYTESAKMTDLNVKKKTLERFTAVSSKTAEEMVLGLHNRTGSSICASVTGYAGPSFPGDDTLGCYYAGIYCRGKVRVYPLRSAEKDRKTIRLDACIHVLELIKNSIE